jgi:hypothetical protein
VNGRDNDSILALEAERSALFAQIEAGGLPECDVERLLVRHEALDWLIAKTPARDLEELEIKFDRLLEATAFDEQDAQATLEGAVMIGLRQDLARMAAMERDSGGC